MSERKESALNHSYDYLNYKMSSSSIPKGIAYHDNVYTISSILPKTVVSQAIYRLRKLLRLSRSFTANSRKGMFKTNALVVWLANKREIAVVTSEI